MNWKVLYPAGKTEGDAPRFREGPVFSSTETALRYLQSTPGTLDAVIDFVAGSSWLSTSTLDGFTSRRTMPNDVGIPIKSAATGTIIAYLTSVE
jgi:hypothetical protein